MSRRDCWDETSFRESVTLLAPTMRRAIFCLIAAVCLFMLARETVIDFYRVRGASMTPTLHPGDYVFADKTAFGSGLISTLFSKDAVPSRGDVVVFALQPKRERYLIKRVVALPHDTLAMRDARLHVNWQPLDEPYLRPASRTPDLSDAPDAWHFPHMLPGRHSHRYAPTGFDWGPLVVPDSALFVLGDNRDASGDSRDFGFVHASELVARPITSLR